MLTPDSWPSPSSSPWVLGFREPSSGAPGQAAPPSAFAHPELARVLDQRRFFAELCKLMGNPSALLPSDAAPHLEQASRALGWMIESALFSAIGPAEQARCQRSREQIDDWLGSSRDPAQAKRIWSAVVAVTNHLAEVNNRSELASYDQRMLDWAFGEVKGRGMTEKVLDHLGTLYGLLPQLNRLLEDPEEVSDDTWVAQIRHALILMGPCSEEQSS